MINYTYQKPISEITENDQNFCLEFTDGISIHWDSVLIPRNPDNSVDLNSLEIAISDLIDYVKNKFNNSFSKS